MRIKNIESWVQFVNALDHCKGNVFLKSKYGDCYNLLSKLSQFLAMNVLMSESADEMELVCTDKEDDKKIRCFLEAA